MKSDEDHATMRENNLVWFFDNRLWRELHYDAADYTHRALWLTSRLLPSLPCGSWRKAKGFQVPAGTEAGLTSGKPLPKVINMSKVLKIQISKTVKRIRFKVHIIRSLLHGSTGGPRCVNPESTILSLRKYELRQQCYTNRAKYLVQNQI